MGQDDGGEHAGQRAGYNTPFLSRINPRLPEGHYGMSRNELISQAYRTVQQINSIEVNRRTPEGMSIDLERTYALRLDNLMGSIILHKLPEGVSARINDRTAELELYVGAKKYSPRKARN